MDDENTVQVLDVFVLDGRSQGVNEQRKKAPVSCILLSTFKDTVNTKMKMHVIIY